MSQLLAADDNSPRARFRETARTALATLDQFEFILATATTPSQALPVLLGAEWSVLSTYKDKTGGKTACDYEVAIIERNHAERAFAAVLMYNDTASPQHGGSTLWEHATKRARMQTMSTALRNAAFADTLVDLLKKAQRQVLTWPAPKDIHIPDGELNAPRLAACRAILSAETDEQPALELLLGLGSFVGLNEIAEPEDLVTRLAWHRAHETARRYVTDLREHHRVQDALMYASARWMATFGNDGLTGFAYTISRTPLMLDDPPLDENGLIERSHFRHATNHYFDRPSPAAAAEAPRTRPIPSNPMP